MKNKTNIKKETKPQASNRKDKKMDWEKRIRELTRIEAYHNGINLKYEHVARWINNVPARKICEVMELAGFPVWSSAPDKAIKPF